MVKKKTAEKKEETALAPTDLLDQFNSVKSETTARDKLIPKILLVHSMSELAKSKDAQEGDFIETLSGTKLGDVEHPIEIVPVWVSKVWIEYAGPPLPKADRVFVSVVPMTAANENLDYVFKNEAGADCCRDRCTNVVVALVSDLKLGVAKPYVVPFRRAKEGGSAKKLITTMELMNPAAKRAKYVGSVVELKTKLVKNPKGNEWLIWDVAELRATTNKELQTILPLFKEASTGLKDAIDNSDLKNDSGEDSAPSAEQAGY